MMLENKWIREFKEDSNFLMPDFKNKIKWVHVGPVDKENPSSLSEDELVVPEYFEWVGIQDSIREFYIKSNIVSLPS